MLPHTRILHGRLAERFPMFVNCVSAINVPETSTKMPEKTPAVPAKPRTLNMVG